MNKETVRKKLVALNFPQMVLDMFDGKLDPFDFELRDPHYVFSDEAPAIKPGLLPLFEMGPKTYFYDQETSVFMNFHLASVKNPKIYGGSIQCLWAGVFLNMYDDETDLDEMKQIARKVGFVHIERLHKEWNDIVSSAGEYYEWEKQFLLSLEKC